MSDNPVLELTRTLVERASITPDDAGCQELLRARLEPLGFRVESMRFGEVDNIWARRGEGGPVLCFAGHTDVVPPGPRTAWDSEPFVPEQREGWLYGRGTADMKASLAAMVVATERFLVATPAPAGSIAFLITSDEEGPGRDGTRAVMRALEARGESIDWCIVGEPSSRETLGDMIRVGRRGSLNADITARGVAGHVAYPELVRNPIHELLPVLAELAATTWDQGNELFPPTSFQVSNIHAGEGVENMVPGEARAKINFRYCTEHSVESLTAAVEGALAEAGLDYAIEWRDSGRPFSTAGGPLVEAVVAAITEQRGAPPEPSTGGGTSDGRFIAPTGTHVVELGPVNATIHKPNERVRVSELEPLARIYEDVLRRLL